MNIEIKRFKVGKTYETRSACDYDCIFSFKIMKRTDSSVWVRERDGKISRRSIRVYSGAEHFRPFGSYSMAPVISAN